MHQFNLVLYMYSVHVVNDYYCPLQSAGSYEKC